MTKESTKGYSRSKPWQLLNPTPKSMKDGSQKRLYPECLQQPTSPDARTEEALTMVRRCWQRRALPAGFLH